MASAKNTKLPAIPPPGVGPGPGDAAAPESLAHLIPYLRPALVVLAIAIVGTIAFAFIRSRGDVQKSGQWRDFSEAYYEASLTRSPDRMSVIAERFPTSMAGLYAYQIAGDLYLRRGLTQLLTDRTAANKALESAKEKYEGVISSSEIDKKSLLYQQALYSLAYTVESLEDCDEAERIYQQLVDLDNESPFALMARRGLARCALAEQTTFFNAWAAFDFDVAGEAPGELLPERPDLDLTPASPPAVEPPASGDPPTGG